MTLPALSRSLLTYILPPNLSVCVSTRMVTRKVSFQTYRQLVGIPSPHYPTNLTTPVIGRENSRSPKRRPPAENTCGSRRTPGAGSHGRPRSRKVGGPLTSLPSTSLRVLHFRRVFGAGTFRACVSSRQNNLYPL
jgi:hypothetical protein